MKKYLALLLLLPTAVMIAGGAYAQRKNTTSHDVRPTCTCNDGYKGCPCIGQPSGDIADNQNNKNSYQKKIDHWADEQNEEINEKYGSILKKINKAGLSSDNTDALQKMAEANKELALEHVSEIAGIIRNNHRKCMSLSRDNHKLCKRLDKLLILED